MAPIIAPLVFFPPGVSVRIAPRAAPKPAPMMMKKHADDTKRESCFTLTLQDQNDTEDEKARDDAQSDSHQNPLRSIRHLVSRHVDSLHSHRPFQAASTEEDKDPTVPVTQASGRGSDQDRQWKRQGGTDAFDQIREMGRGVLGLFVALLALFFALVASGQRGGNTLFTNLALTIPGIGAALSAIAAGVLGGYALTQRDRSIVVILAIVADMAVLFWTTAEIVFPH